MNLENDLIKKRIQEIKDSRSLEKKLMPLAKKDKKKKDKKKKGLWESLWKKKKLEKTNTVAILYLRENGNADTFEIKSREGFFEIEGKTYHERKDCTYTMGKDRVPLAVIREWSMVPEGRKEWEERAMQEKVAICQDHLMKGIRHAERVRMGEGQGGNQLTPKAMILIGIGVIILIAVLMGYS